MKLVDRRDLDAAITLMRALVKRQRQILTLDDARVLLWLRELRTGERRESGH